MCVCHCLKPSNVSYRKNIIIFRCTESFRCSFRWEKYTMRVPPPCPHPDTLLRVFLPGSHGCKDSLSNSFAHVEAVLYPVKLKPAVRSSPLCTSVFHPLKGIPFMCGPSAFCNVDPPVFPSSKSPAITFSLWVCSFQHFSHFWVYNLHIVWESFVLSFSRNSKNLMLQPSTHRLMGG